MSRPVTLVTGQWTDLPPEELARKAAAWGYDGLEMVCRSGYIDVDRAVSDSAYCRERLELLARHGLKCFALSNHAAGHLVCDPNSDRRTDVLAPPACAGDAERKRAWAVAAMKNTARAARNLGVNVVTGFTGSPIWHLLYRFPPVPEEWIEEGYARFAQLWNPILDVFDECGVVRETTRSLALGYRFRRGAGETPTLTWPQPLLRIAPNPIGVHDCEVFSGHGPFG
jgi:sugar phosphate isomerase/epimerase